MHKQIIHMNILTYFFCGITSLFNLFPPPPKPTSFEDDWQSIQEDWKNIGQDIYKGLKAYNYKKGS